ncbi:MAG: carboxypeptidase-like regulatory domain-containing protein, partial [Bacteroidota bacterium]
MIFEENGYKITLILILAMVTSMPIFSQSQDTCTYKIVGKVIDQTTKLPLAYANVVLEGTTIGTITGEEGEFEILDLCEKEYDLEISYIGYKSKSYHYDYHNAYLEIQLASDQTLIESVVVVAEYSEGGLQSSTTATLSGEALESVQTESFAEAASQITGVNMLSTGQNVAKPIIHGLHSNRVLTINNGLRHEFQNWGIDHAPEIDPSAIDQIEVIKGAATVRFGPEALGGVILTNPAPMELSTPFKAEIGLVGKSNGQSGEGNIELRKGFKWLSLMAGGSYLKQGDLQAPNYNLTNTGKEEESYYGGFRLHPIANLDIEGYYSRFDQNLGILLGSTFGNLVDFQRGIEAEEPAFTREFSYDIGQPRQDVSHELYKATARYTGTNQSIELKYGYQINARKEFGQRRGESPTIDLELVTNSLDLDWVHPKIGPFSGKMGAQWQNQANDNLPGTNTVPFVPNYDSERLGAYMIESVQFGNNTIELGMRYDWMIADITGREPDNTIYENTIEYSNLTATLG